MGDKSDALPLKRFAKFRIGEQPFDAEFHACAMAGN
jgi:hypothetical protein